jgi:hypothetical protein
VTDEPEILCAVDLCDARGRLASAARGWSRHPLHRANLRGNRGRKKRWDYWAIITPQVIASVTYADVDYIGLATLWALDRETGRQGGSTLIRPFGRGFDLPEQPCTGSMSVRSRSVAVDIVDDTTRTHLVATGGRGDSAASLDVSVDRPADHETMNVVIPWSDRRFQYTSKQTARPARGTITLGARQWTFDGANDDAWGVLDLGRGIWPYRNRWNWAAAAGHSNDGAIIGLQFGGKWTEGTGFTENALCIDGRLSKIGEELEWSYSWDDPMSPWRVRTRHSDQVDVTLTPTFDRHDRTSVGVLSMEVHQSFGTWSGVIRGDDGATHTIDGMHGFAEEARNRW